MANLLKNNKEFRMLPLHEALRVKRAVTGDTFEYVANLLGLSVSNVFYIENGRTAVPTECMPALCEYLYGKEKRSLEKKERKVEEYSIGFRPLNEEQDLPYVLELPNEHIATVLWALKLRVLYSTDDYLLYEPFVVTIVRDDCLSPKYVATGRLQDFYDVLFTPNGIELTEKKGA